DGFIVAQKDVFAQTRSGRQVLNVREGGAVACKVLSSAMDSVAVVGENRKLLVFPLAELPLMARGKGVRLQKYKDGGLADVTGFVLADGLRWLDPAGRNRVEADLAGWSGKRAGAGRLAPRGFPQDGKFNC
ncbi:MAG: DNA topoisomerase IV subunit A, partial [Proteobacteria bacterium]|nr:DNA topoisomerase IV subunit A [Pseudomonadota bacterium]